MNSFYFLPIVGFLIFFGNTSPTLDKMRFETPEIFARYLRHRIRVRVRTAADDEMTKTMALELMQLEEKDSHNSAKFLLGLLKEDISVDLQTTFVALASRNCRSQDCQELFFNTVQTIPHNLFSSALSDYMTGFFEYDNFDLIQKRKEIFSTYFTFLAKIETFDDQAFTRAIKFGFYPEALAIAEKHQEQIYASPNITYGYCRLLYSVGNFAKARECSSRLSSNWAQVRRLYIDYLDHGKVDLNKFNNLKSSILANDKERNFLHVFIFEYLFFKKWDKNIENFINKGEKAEATLFMLLILNQTNPILPDKLTMRLRDEYISMHPKSILTKVLNKEVPVDVLKAAFGPHNMLYRAASFSK